MNLRSLSPLLVSWAVVLQASPGSAQDCASAAVCCRAAMAAMGQPPTACEQIASAPPAACGAIAARFAAMLAASRQPVPAACGAAPPSGGGGGAPPESPPQQPAGGPPGGPQGNPQSAPPQPLPPENNAPVPSSSGQVGCVIERLDGHRVMLAGAAQSFELRCTGIESASGPPVAPSNRSYDGRSVSIRWRAAPDLGVIDSQAGARATYRAAPRITGNANEVVLHAVVILEGPRGARREQVDVPRTIHIVNRHMTLDVDVHTVTHCTGMATLTAGFDLTCHQTIELEVGEDLAVRGSGGQSCGSGSWSGLQACGPAGQPSVPGAQFSLDAVAGQIDPDSAVMTLQITGNRLGYPDMNFGSRRDAAHAVALFPRPLQLSPDDGAVRSFGSLTTNASAGGTTSFALHTR